MNDAEKLGGLFGVDIDFHSYGAKIEDERRIVFASPGLQVETGLNAVQADRRGNDRKVKDDNKLKF